MIIKVCVIELLLLQQCFSWFLTDEETKLAVQLARKLEIRYCFFVTDDHVIPTVKGFSSNNIITRYFTYDQFETLISRWDYVQFKTGIILKEKNSSRLETMPQKFDNEDVFTFVKYQMSQFAWIVFLDFPAPRMYWNNVKIPYDCEFIAIQKTGGSGWLLSEVYQVNNRSVVCCLGEWNHSLKITNVSLYWRRLNLNRSRIIIYTSKTFESQIDEYGRKTVKNVRQQTEKLMEDFSYMMNFELQQIDDAKQTMFDILNEPKYMTTYDYTTKIGPIFRTVYNWYIKYPVVYLRPDYYLQPFETNLWLAILTFIIAGSIAILIMHKPLNNDKRIFTDDLFLTMETFCNQNGSRDVKNLSSRLSCVAFKSLAMIITASFGAVITSFIAVEILEIPFTNLEEFAENDHYKLIFFSRSTLAQLFEESQNPLIRYLNEERVEKFETWDVKENMLICERENVAVPFENYYFETANLTCPIYRLPRHITFADYGIPVSPTSTFVKVFNHNIVRIYEYGIRKRMQDILYDRPLPRRHEESFKPIEIEQMIQVLSIPLVGAVLSLIIVFCELIY